MKQITINLSLSKGKAFPTDSKNQSADIISILKVLFTQTLYHPASPNQRHEKSLSPSSTHKKTKVKEISNLLYWAQFLLLQVSNTSRALLTRQPDSISPAATLWGIGPPRTNMSYLWFHSFFVLFKFHYVVQASHKLGWIFLSQYLTRWILYPLIFLYALPQIYNWKLEHLSPTSMGSTE